MGERKHTNLKRFPNTQNVKERPQHINRYNTQNHTFSILLCFYIE